MVNSRKYLAELLQSSQGFSMFEYFFMFKEIIWLAHSKYQCSSFSFKLAVQFLSICAGGRGRGKFIQDTAMYKSIDIRFAGSSL